MAKGAMVAHIRHTKKEVLLAGRLPARAAEEAASAYKSGDLPYFIEWAESSVNADPDGAKKERLQLSLAALRLNINEDDLRGAAFHAFFAGYFLGVTGEEAEQLRDVFAKSKSHSEHVVASNKNRGFTPEDNERLRPQLEKMLERDSARLNFTYGTACASLADQAEVGRDRFMKLTRSFAIEKGLLKPRLRKEKKS